MDFEDVVMTGYVSIAIVLIVFAACLYIAKICTEPEVTVRKDSVMIYFGERIEARPVYVNNEKVWEVKK